MRSQSVLIIATRRSSAMSLMIVLAAMFFVSCNSTQPSQPVTPQSLNSISSPQLGTRHDIPPEIVVDVGSFSINTKESITNGPPPNSVICNNTPCIYKGVNTNVSMAIIKVIRADDGAILYQNFSCANAEIEFTAHDSVGSITIKNGDQSGSKIIKFESGRSLTVETNNTSPSGRKQKLKDDNLKIKRVTIKNSSGTLFSYDTPVAPGLLDKYRVVIKLEDH